MSSGGRYLNINKNNTNHYDQDYQEKPKKKGWLIALIVVIVLAVLITAGVFLAKHYVMGFVDSKLDLINRPERVENELSQEELDAILNYNPDANADIETYAPVETTEAVETTETTVPPTTEETIHLSDIPAENIINIMLVGQSYRPGEETKLADSMILCSINKETKTLTMTSFLRDMYIQLPNYKGHTCGKQRINVCYNLGWKWGGDLGAMEMLNLCLYNNFGIEVDHNVEINFDSFMAIIDLLGGVDIELTEAEVEYLKDPAYNGVNDYVKPGLNTLNAETALAYARARHLDGDIQRSGRQRKVITSLLNRARSLSISEINSIADEILPLITTNMSNEDIKGYLIELLPMLPELKIENGVCPAEGTYWPKTVDIGGYPANVLEPDIYRNKVILQEIAEGIVPKN